MLHPARTLAAIALAAGLAACGGPAEQEPTETAASPAVAPAPEAAGTATVAGAPAAAPASASEAAAVPAPEASAPAPAAQPAAAPSAAKAPPASFAICRTCHAVEPGKNGVGPTLAGIVGSKAGDVAGYQFSPALKQSGIVWSRATLDQWLAGPIKMVPGTKMVINVSDPAKRKEIIDYLETLK